MNTNIEANSAQATPIVDGQAVIVTKGCSAREIRKGLRGKVGFIKMMGAEYGHNVKVVLDFGVRRVAFYARHVNRLSDDTIRLNDGNPLHVIEIKRAP